MIELFSSMFVALACVLLTRAIYYEVRFWQRKKRWNDDLRKQNGQWWKDEP